MSDEMTGGCACGKVRYTAQVDNDEAYLCHCRMCQRATGSVSIAFKNMKKADVAWERRAGLVCIARRSRAGLIARPAAPRSASPIRTARRWTSPSPRSTIPRGSGRQHHFGAESMHRAWINTEGLPEYALRRISAARRPLDEGRWQAPRLGTTFTPPDGVELAWHELGEGRPVVLLHGLFSDADTNWIRFGHAAEIAARGFRVIMPDLRAPRHQRQAARCRRLSARHPGR